MRLLTYDGSRSLSATLVDDENIPPYAMLSHTWRKDEEEVTLHEIGSQSCQTKEGYRKIDFCRQQAHRDGHRHFWIDTCCIDKTNHVELSEAITSMYRWYQNAHVCYVYLSDVPYTMADDSSSRGLWEPSFRASRWFSRGWTLQELLAPKQVVFYSKEWEYLGTKTTLIDLIHEITGIPITALDNQPLSQFTVAERFRWVQGRQTKKKEDQAYCLFGLFNVYMYLNYGEGHNAWVRLNKAINEMAPVAPSLPVVRGAMFDSYDQTHQSCHPATRIDLLQSVQDWAHDVHGKSIFWLKGAAGTGKSTISWTLAKRLTDLAAGAVSTVTFGASFFFKRGEGERGSAALLFPTIASQLAVRLHSFDTFLAQAISADPLCHTKSLSTQLKELVFKPFQLVSSNASRMTYIVIIDALDECEKQNDILVFLQLWSTLPTDGVRLRLFLTSRPELPLRLGFKKMSTDVHHDFILHEIPRPVIQHDITAFLTTVLNDVRINHNIMLEDDDDLAEAKLAEGWPGDQIIRELTQIAMPLFIVAATIHRLLRKATDPQKCLQTILQSRNSASFSEIGSIYKIILQTLTATDQDQETISQAYLQFRTIVGAIVTLVEPLSRISLAALLDVSSSEVQRCLQPLHAVLEIPSEKEALIRPLHLSFGDYLTSREVQNLPYGVNTEVTHDFLQRQCLRLLSHRTGLRENICDLNYTGQPRATLPPTQIENGLLPEIRYACRYWVYHVQHSVQQLQDESEVYEFLKKHFLHWLEALSLTNHLSEAISHLSILQSCTSTEAHDLSAFLRDAKRFVLTNRYIIDQSPLQIYSSAIIFAPESSLVRKFCGRIPSWIKQYPMTPKRWNFELQKLEGHTASVESVAFSRDGHLLASGSFDTKIRLWNVQTGQEVQVLEGHNRSVRAVAFSHDGPLLASGANDNTVRVWNTQTGREVQMFEGHSKVVNTVEFSPDCSVLASGSDDETIQLWNPSTGKRERTFIAHSGVFSVAFSPNSLLLASALCDGTVQIWDTSSGVRVHHQERNSAPALAVAFSPKTTLLAFGSQNSIRLCDTKTYQEVRELQGHYEIVTALAFSSDSSLLVSGAGDGMIILWDPSTGSRLQELNGHASRVTSVAFSLLDTFLLASGSIDSTIRLWDASAGHQVKKLLDDTDKLIGDALRCVHPAIPDRLGSTTQFWGEHSDQELLTLNKLGGGFRHIAWSHDGSLLASASHQIVQLLNAKGDRGLKQLAVQPSLTPAVFFSSDDSLLISPSGFKETRIWRLETDHSLEYLPSFAGMNSLPTAAESSHDGSLLALGYDKMIIVYDIQTGQEVRRFHGYHGLLKKMKFSSTGSLLASAINFTIRLWSIQTGQQIRTFSPCFNSVTAMAFSLDDSSLISAFTDGTLRRWDTQSGREKERSKIAEVAINSAAMNTFIEGVEYSTGDIVRMLRSYDTRPRNYDVSRNWIRKDQKNLLWLPFEYRGAASAHGDKLAIVTPTGLIRIFEFEFSKDTQSAHDDTVRIWD